MLDVTNILKKIKGGWTDIDVIIYTVHHGWNGALGRVLGPHG